MSVSVSESAYAVRALVALMIWRCSRQASKIIVGGFSQGAALSLYVGYSLPVKLAGVVALSGYGCGLLCCRFAPSAKN